MRAYVCIWILEYVKLTLQYLKELICAILYMFWHVISGRITEDTSESNRLYAML